MNKACPVVLRYNHNALELLAFRHPNASKQLVKGGIKKGEPLENACVRELQEESGIQAQVVRQLGSWEPGFKNQVWGFCLMHYEGVLPDSWDFFTQDDDGHIFSFFWHPLSGRPDDEWTAVSRGAFQYIKSCLGN
jgi:8-oxo-dGTP pyrophosphatase MutT (NUDIX family)